MKNIISKLKIISIAVLVLSTYSCDAILEEDITDFGTGPNFVGFSGATLTLSAQANGEESSAEVPIRIIGPSVPDLTQEMLVMVSVDPASTAVEGLHYRLDSNSLVLTPQDGDGDMYQQMLPITILTEGIEPPLAEAPLLILNISELDSNENVVINNKTESVRISINYLCPSNLAGTYSVTTTYITHDFLSNYPSNTMEMEITENSFGTYSVPDFSGGLYGTGPYSSSYGTSGLEVTFTDSCDKISWSDQSDPWGDLVPSEGGVNEVDPETGIITISWTAEAYGEKGVSVYTPIE